MKFFYYLIIFWGIISCESPHDGYLIKGNINGLKNGKALLQRRVESQFQTIDSSAINNGTFTFKGKIESPEMCYIHISDSLPYIRLFAENSEILVEAHIDSLGNPVILGSPSQDLLSVYNKRIQPFEERLQETYGAYREAYQTGDTKNAKNLETKFDQIAEEQKKESLEFVKENSWSAVSPYLVWGTLAYDMDVGELEDISREFAPEIRNSIYVQQIADYIQTLKKVDIGQSFTEIALPDTTGQIRKLSDLKGKLILIDFWASWCGPCRRENPNVVSLYNEYKNNNFEIFGVSLDENEQNWEKAIVDDQLTWYHVSDLKGWKSKGAELYGVRSIPHTVLIDVKGKIIAKNLRGDDLRNKIEELLHN
jgi:thiol-disulfide isomerase/thioredoxin